MTPISMGKKYQTADGREVIIDATDRGGLYPIQGAVKLSGGGWSQHSWTSEGRYDVRGPSGYDLIEVRSRIKGWVNWYTGGPQTLAFKGYGYTTKDEADKYADTDRVACSFIDIPQGEGL